MSDPSDAAQAQDLADSAVRKLLSALSQGEASALFPNGLARVSAKVKLRDSEIALEVEGHSPTAEARARELFAVATKRVKIVFGANGEGTLSYEGQSFPCLGSTQVAYAKDLTVTATLDKDKFLQKFSEQYKVWMEYSILIMGMRGIYIHEYPDTLESNGGVETAGCIHLGPDNAEKFWNWVDGPTRITIEYPWIGA